jgi:hypothetical protein
MNADKTKTTPKVFAYLRSSAFIGVHRRPILPLMPFRAAVLCGRNRCPAVERVALRVKLEKAERSDWHTSVS